MEQQWSVRDDSPYANRYGPSSKPWWLLILAVILLGAGAGYYFWQRDDTPPAPLTSGEPPTAPPSAQASVAEPAPRYPVPSAEEDPAKPLPSLDNSDAMMRDSVSGLVGRKAFEALVHPTQLIRRIVATVDNLPRETAPTRVMPLAPVPGTFTAGASNPARYAPYVRIFESVDARGLVQRYIESYPLFQRAYTELGFADRHFNDRLLEAIDDLLAAPELAGELKLVQPKVLYQFEDPELEGRSAGQKIMMRMGGENAAKVKAKLREIRRELVQR